jgi:hypothetical protein
LRDHLEGLVRVDRVTENLGRTGLLADGRRQRGAVGHEGDVRLDNRRQRVGGGGQRLRQLTEVLWPVAHDLPSLREFPASSRGQGTESSGRLSPAIESREIERNSINLFHFIQSSQ